MKLKLFWMLFDMPLQKESLIRHNLHHKINQMYISDFTLQLSKHDTTPHLGTLKQNNMHRTFKMRLETQGLKPS